MNCGPTEPRSKPCRADFRDPDTARGVVSAAIERYGQLDILINNAGWTPQ